MSFRTASTAWEGGLQDGKGRTSLDSSGTATFDVSFPSRVADSPHDQTDPEELIGAALATCFSENLAGTLGRNDVTLKTLQTTAKVRLDKTDQGLTITGIELTARATVDGADQERFAELAAEAERTCPVSKALAGTTITLDASLQS
jgi:osmotically inducible protein OsmC